MNFPLGSKILQVAYGLLAATKSAEDEVAVFDSTLNQAFPAARPVKVNVTPMSKLMDHPVEDGSIITDFRVILPTQLELALVCSGDQYKSVYQQIKTAYLSGNVFIIIDKADTYFNMMIAGIPYDMNSDMMDGIMVGVRFREVKIITTQYQPLSDTDVKNTNDQSTLNSGTKTPAEAPDKAPDSILSKWLPKAFQ